MSEHLKSPGVNFLLGIVLGVLTGAVFVGWFLVRVEVRATQFSVAASRASSSVIALQKQLASAEYELAGVRSQLAVSDANPASVDVERQLISTESELAQVRGQLASTDKGCVEIPATQVGVSDSTLSDDTAIFEMVPSSAKNNAGADLIGMLAKNSPILRLFSALSSESAESSETPQLRWLIRGKVIPVIVGNGRSGTYAVWYDHNSGAVLSQPFLPKKYSEVVPVN